MCSEDAESLLHILTFFGMTAGGSTALAENREGVFGIVTGFLHSICALEIVPLALRQTVLASCFCVAGAVVAAPPSDDGVELVEQDPCVLKFAMHILEVLHRKEEQRRISQEESSTGSHADATVTSSGQKSNDRDAEAGGADRPFRTVDGAEDSSEVTRERTTAADSADNRASGRADSTEQAGDVPSPRTKESSEVVEQQVAPGDVSNEEPAAILHEQLMRFIRDLIMALPQEQFSPIHAVLNEAKRSQRLLLLRHLLDESPECVRRLHAVAALKGSRLHHLQHAIAGLLPEKEEDGKGSPTAAASSSSVS
ncbi:PREDICTED: uncharacterized protein LOC106810058 [Priapulus caudatus]|uniref:Uncharacterized protein LOC106810058 n=1 Tax=Priapulus caudatus TaxID=37621 RepID=A0ABM1E9D8_PRICU|nr:PREDICTED: uncharacterized protein LOC106810058 [Priapulus caudatus]